MQRSMLKVIREGLLRIHLKRFLEVEIKMKRGNLSKIFLLFLISVLVGLLFSQEGCYKSSDNVTTKLGGPAMDFILIDKNGMMKEKVLGELSEETIAMYLEVLT